jgi:hypothetical protein
MILASYRKRRALRSYRSTLGARLRGRYGTRQSYTPDEVRDTARWCGVSDVFLCYALAMYCERAAFDAYHAANGEACDYDAMRHEIGARLFDGDTSFDGATLTDPDHPHSTLEATSDAGSDGWFGGDAGGCCLLHRQIERQRALVGGRQRHAGVRIEARGGAVRGADRGDRQIRPGARRAR